ncbi:hypothetical protein G7L54_23930, partial [Shigella sonnei]|uniref:hypothetical protein n=1 Tax=Shigella sonnei TaxID=624 RepID=UPI00149467D9
YTDVTDQAKTEAEARRFAGYLEAVIEHLPMGVTVFDETLRMACLETLVANAEHGAEATAR